MEGAARVPDGSLARRIGIGLLAHAVASFAGAVAFVVLSLLISQSAEALAAFLFILLVILVAGLPGFVALRVLLHLTGRNGWAWFVAAGMANGACFVLLMEVNSGHPVYRGTGMILFSTLVVGAVAGAVYRKVEQAMLHLPEDRT